MGTIGLKYSLFCVKIDHLLNGPLAHRAKRIILHRFHCTVDVGPVNTLGYINSAFENT